MKYCYAVTCERRADGAEVRVSGDCFNKFENACKWTESRADKPKALSNPMLYASEDLLYKIITLTYAD